MKKLLFLLVTLPILCYATSDGAQSANEQIAKFILSNKTRALLFYQVQGKAYIGITLQSATERQDTPMSSMPKLELQPINWSGKVKAGEIYNSELWELQDVDLRLSIDLKRWFAIKYRTGFFEVWQNEEGSKLLGRRTTDDNDKPFELEESSKLCELPLALFYSKD